jgi:hypothetical protein
MGGAVQVCVGDQDVEVVVRSVLLAQERVNRPPADQPNLYPGHLQCREKLHDAEGVHVRLGHAPASDQCRHAAMEEPWSLRRYAGGVKDILVVVVVLGFLVLLTVYVSGRDYFVFGIAAAAAVLGGVWIWVGVLIAAVQAGRLAWRYRRRRLT